MKAPNSFAVFLIFVAVSWIYPANAPANPRCNGVDPCFLPYPEPEPVKVPVPTGQDPLPPLVSIKVRVPACVAPGDKLEYRVLVENCSPSPAYHVTVKSKVPANAKFVRAEPEPHRTEPELQWSLGTMQPRACREISVVLSAPGTEDVKACFRVQFEHGECVTTRRIRSPYMPPSDEEPGTGKPTEKEPTKPPVITPSQAKLNLRIDGPLQQKVTDPAQYTFTLTNVGTSRATKILADTTLSDKLTFVSASDDGQLVKAGFQAVAWRLGDLDPGASKTFTLVVRAKQTGRHCLQTRVLADDNITVQAEACTVFFGTSALLLEMFDRVDPVPLGETTSYPIMVFNQGDIPVTNLRIQAFVPKDMDVTRAKGPVDHKVAGKVVTFNPIPLLGPGETAEVEVFVRVLGVGEQRFQIQLDADELKEGGPVRESESTTVYDEDNPPGGIRATSTHSGAHLLLLALPRP